MRAIIALLDLVVLLRALYRAIFISIQINKIYQSLYNQINETKKKNESFIHLALFEKKTRHKLF